MTRIISTIFSPEFHSNLEYLRDIEISVILYEINTEHF